MRHEKDEKIPAMQSVVGDRVLLHPPAIHLFLHGANCLARMTSYQASFIGFSVC